MIQKHKQKMISRDQMQKQDMAQVSNTNQQTCESFSYNKCCSNSHKITAKLFNRFFSHLNPNMVTFEVVHVSFIMINLVVTHIYFKFSMF